MAASPQRGSYRHPWSGSSGSHGREARYWRIAPVRPLNHHLADAAGAPEVLLETRVLQDLGPKPAVQAAADRLQKRTVDGSRNAVPLRRGVYLDDRAGEAAKPTDEVKRMNTTSFRTVVASRPINLYKAQRRDTYQPAATHYQELKIQVSWPVAQRAGCPIGWRRTQSSGRG